MVKKVDLVLSGVKMDRRSQKGPKRMENWFLKSVGMKMEMKKSVMQLIIQ